MNIVKSTADYDYEIVRTHERINRLLPMRSISDAGLLELGDLYRHINSVMEAKKANSQWAITDFDKVVENSKLGRERIAIYPYPKNPFDNIAKHNKMIKRSKFNRAWKIVKLRLAQTLVNRQ